MWGAASMTFFEAHSNIHPFEKFINLLVVSPAKRALSPEFRQTYSLHPVSVFVKMSGFNVIIPRVFGVGVGVGLWMGRMRAGIGGFGFGQ